MKRVNIQAMKQGSGELVELYLENGLTGGRILCSQKLIPAPGQYLQIHDPASSDALPASIFPAGSVPGGFLAAPSISQTWQPGTTLSLRGPLGRGFSMPASARRVAIVVLSETTSRLKSLLFAALGQSASVVLVCELDVPDLSPEVEIRPISAFPEVAQWADYIAIDSPREALPGLRQKLGFSQQAKAQIEAQALVVTPMPCGGLADCGVCAVFVRRGWKMACKDGPVFDLNDLK